MGALVPRAASGAVDLDSEISTALLPAQKYLLRFAYSRWADYRRLNPITMLRASLEHNLVDNTVRSIVRQISHF